MSLVEKLFAWFIVAVSFGAGAFHILAAYVPMFLHFLEPHSTWLSLIAVSFLMICFVAILVLLMVHKKQHTSHL